MVRARLGLVRYAVAVDLAAAGDRAYAGYSLEVVRVTGALLTALLTAPGCLSCGGPVVPPVSARVCLCLDCEVYDLELANFSLDVAQAATCVIVGALPGELVNDCEREAWYWPDDYC